nr:187-kDa microtubule-associated protein AIR9 [Ipomoea batatas]
MSSSWEDVGVAVASMVLATFSMLDKPENVFLITFAGAPCFPISAIASPNSPTVEANFCRIPATLSTLDDGIFNAATGASCIPSNPTVRNIKILGDFKVDKKIKICGTVIGGTEQASIVQLFVAISENFDMEENLKAISESKTEKEFYLPLEVVGHYVVVKYTPMSEDGKFGEPVFVTSNKMVESPSLGKGGLGPCPGPTLERGPRLKV